MPAELPVFATLLNVMVPSEFFLAFPKTLGFNNRPMLLSSFKPAFCFGVRIAQVPSQLGA
jgi:hypothetical protein